MRQLPDLAERQTTLVTNATLLPTRLVIKTNNRQFDFVANKNILSNRCALTAVAISTRFGTNAVPQR
eukprot:7034500-Alexandrium_andersonii.AAC.1